MKHHAQYTPHHLAVELPANLPDEAAAALVKLLRNITDSLEYQYAEQLARHEKSTNQRQARLWDDNDLPF